MSRTRRDEPEAVEVTLEVPPDPAWYRPLMILGTIWLGLGVPVFLVGLVGAAVSGASLFDVAVVFFVTVGAPGFLVWRLVRDRNKARRPSEADEYDDVKLIY